ncbi:helix-turn-helix transcriptional regulator [Bittarella massiliensis]|nr:helix-turn-helix transcriptional regulator [Bittarella massiliensis (ex Durand et al. 2017)]MBO1679022.1 helix-turn-helix transcriptional regulator [Bittarella massiliensis (ex Durand et al. 2017)]
MRTVLREQGLKQVELAEQLGVSANYISLLVNGKKQKVSLTLAKLIESLYGYPAEWIMEGEGAGRRVELLRQRVLNRVLEMGVEDLLQLRAFLEKEKEGPHG